MAIRIAAAMVILTAAAVALGCTLLHPTEADALQGTDIAGYLGDDAVSVTELDQAIAGAAAKTWREIDAVIRAAGQGVCRQRAYDELDARQSSENWRIAAWQSAQPTSEAVAAFVRDNPDLFAGVDPDDELVRHRLRVERYRTAIGAAADAVIDGRFKLELPNLADPPTGEPQLAEKVGNCMSSAISRDEIERFAAYPLYRRRAELVSTICAQFEIDYSNPLLLSREASKQGLTVEQLFEKADDAAEPATAAEIEEAARKRYGDADDLSRMKAELALQALRQGDARMELVERLRAATTGRCTLDLPSAPVVARATLKMGDLNALDARTAPPEPAARATPTTSATGASPQHNTRLPVAYFANFRCRQCKNGWDVARDTLRAYDERIDFSFVHHFPATVEPMFADALAAQCASQAGKLDAWAKAYFANAAARPTAKQLGLDNKQFDACIADAATAVKVLADTDEGLRMGFREAVPSWVIGRRPRRGYQRAAIVAATIDEELEATCSLGFRNHSGAVGTRDRAAGELPKDTATDTKVAANPNPQSWMVRGQKEER